MKCTTCETTSGEFYYNPALTMLAGSDNQIVFCGDCKDKQENSVKEEE